MGMLDSENSGNQATQAAPTTPTFSSPYTVSTTPTAIAVSSPDADVSANDPATAAPAASPDVPDAASPAAAKSRVTLANQKAIRSLPLKPELVTVLDYAATAAGVDEVRVGSGGQTSERNPFMKGKTWTGSHRHDLGGAADVKLYVGGKPVSFLTPAGRAIFEKFTTAAASAGATGIGAGVGYMGSETIHVGFGNPATWGGAAWLRPAYDAGRASPMALAPSAAPSPAASAAEAQATGAPIPPARPDTASPAFGAKGARSMPETIAFGALGAMVIDRGRIIGKGERGDHVAELQDFLNAQGFLDARGNPLTVDGDFGRMTKQALKAYQARSNITADGRVGPETYQAMLFDVAPGMAVMPGKAAYDRGSRVAGKIVDPAAPDAAVPLPRRRPVQDVDIRLPRTNPRRQDVTTDASPSTFPARPEKIGALPAASYDGSGVPMRPGDPDAIMGPWNPRFRGFIEANMEAAHSVFLRNWLGQPQPSWTPEERAIWQQGRDRAAAAADRAMLQRFDDAHAPAANIDVGALAIRTGEAIREFARGLSDRYRQAIDAKKTLRDSLTAAGGRTKDDAVMPSPAPVVPAELMPYGFAAGQRERT